MSRVGAASGARLVAPARRSASRRSTGIRMFSSSSSPLGSHPRSAPDQIRAQGFIRESPATLEPGEQTRTASCLPRRAPNDEGLRERCSANHDFPCVASLSLKRTLKCGSERTRNTPQTVERARKRVPISSPQEGERTRSSENNEKEREGQNRRSTQWCSHHRR